jgi:hypothetical protein
VASWELFPVVIAREGKRLLGGVFVVSFLTVTPEECSILKNRL